MKQLRHQSYRHIMGSNHPIGTKVLYFEELDSTNEYACNLLSSKSRPVHGTVIQAGHQSKGKGQLGRNWLTAPGQNITLSAIVYPKINATDQFCLNILSSLAVIDTLNEVADINPMIKWPNDILVDKMKICGILIKNFLSGSQIHSSVIGIGLNVNQKGFHKELTQACSLATVTEQNFDLLLIRSTLLKYLNIWWQRHTEPQVLRREYLNHLWGYNQKKKFIRGDQRMYGTITGIDEIGRLCIDWENEEIGVYQMGELRIIINDT